jgi:hypothetical protein
VPEDFDFGEDDPEPFDTPLLDDYDTSGKIDRHAEIIERFDRIEENQRKMEDMIRKYQK